MWYWLWPSEKGRREIISEKEDNEVSWADMIVRYSGAFVWLLTNSHGAVMAVLWVRRSTMRLLLRRLRLIPWGCVLWPATKSVHTPSILWFQYACSGGSWSLLLIISACVRQRRNEAAVTSRSHTCLYFKSLVSFSHALGTEPWSFYFVNGFLNFNVAFILALLVLPLTCVMECLLQKFHGECKTAVRAKHRQPRTQPCYQRGSLPAKEEVKLGSGKVFGIIGKFLELAQFNIDPTMELLCRKKTQWDASTYILSAEGQKHVFLFRDDSCVPCFHLKKSNVLSRLNYPYPE